jgi:hypothetical protein
MWSDLARYSCIWRTENTRANRDPLQNSYLKGSGKLGSGGELNNERPKPCTIFFQLFRVTVSVRESCNLGAQDRMPSPALYSEGLTP